MKSIERNAISELISKAILHDVKSNLALMRQYVGEANKVDAHQVDPNNIDTEIAFSLWVFVYNTLWLELNIKDERLRQELISSSIVAYSELTGLKTELIDRWFQQMSVGRELVEHTGKTGFMALPLMFYLGYGDYKSLQVQLTFSYAATLYVAYLESVSGYWDKAFKLYQIS